MMTQLSKELIEQLNELRDSLKGDGIYVNELNTNKTVFMASDKDGFDPNVVDRYSILPLIQ